MHGQLPLNALRAFEVAARHLSFTKAAEELNVTPAAVSQQIKMLEDYVGSPLFHRLTRGLALTKSAHAALPALQSGFSSVTRGMQQLRNDRESNRLNVWTAPSFASKLLLPRLNKFTAVHPEIDLGITASEELVDSDSPEQLIQAKHFQQHGMDIAIRFGNGHYPACRVDRLMPASVAPLCSPRLLTDPSRPLVEPRDLIRHTLLHDDTQYEGRPEWEDWLAMVGVESAADAKSLRFNHVSLALEAACDEQGIALTIEQLAAVDIERGRLVVPFDLRIHLDCAYYIISPNETADTPAIIAFREWLLSECSADKTSSAITACC
ncbi:MAG: transcriptional regulator GcvA [Granulosicoccus sp.]|nr:transcriptional regulator GcvA [Granulosicoccus sp.]